MKARLTAFLRGATGTAQPWRPDDRPYPALAALDPRELANQSGVYVLWHLGVRPRWLRAGGAADLAAALTRLKDMPEMHAAEAHGGAYIAWALLPLAEIPQAIAALAAQTRPTLQHMVLAGEIGAAAEALRPFPLPPGSSLPGVDESSGRNRQG